MTISVLTSNPANAGVYHLLYIGSNIFYSEQTQFKVTVCEFYMPSTQNDITYFLGDILNQINLLPILANPSSDCFVTYSFSPSNTFIVFRSSPL